MIRHLEEGIRQEVGHVLDLCQDYVQAIKNFYRQLSLQSNELVRGTAITKLELVFNNLKNEHYRLMSSHLSSEIFNILKETCPVARIKTINFTAYPASNLLSKQSTGFFDKLELPHSSDKSKLEDFETHSSFLVKLDYFEKVNIGHIYCVEDIRKNCRIISGKFGTAICNDTDQIISKIKHHAEKIYNCRFWNSYQLYFPNDEKIFIWKDDGIVLTLNHRFVCGQPHELINFSKCVQSVGDLVFFLAVPSQIIELDWKKMEKDINHGAHSFTGRLVFEAKGILDFSVYKKAVFYVTTSARVGKAFVHQDSPASQQGLIDPNHLFYSAIAANSSKVIVAGHQEAITSNILFVLNHDLTTLSKVAVQKLDKGYNPIRVLHTIEREDASYLLCVCSIDLIILFSETESSLSRLEQVCLSKQEEKAMINGIHFDKTKSKAFVFGDFNFQQMLKLRV